MNIIASDTECRFHSDDVKELALVREICRARPSGYQFMTRFKRGYWDGYISLMKDMSTFPTGLLPIIESEFYKRGLKTQVQYPKRDDIEVREITADILNGVILRGYQVDAGNSMLEAERGVGKMATNSGKTEVMASLIWAIDRPTTVVVHVVDLMYQTAKRFEERLGIRVGIIGDGKSRIEKVNVAMVQTLHRNWPKYIQKLNKNVLLMVDECHHVSSSQMLSVLDNISGRYRFGFSGTPLKHDDLSDLRLLGATGDIIVDVSNEELISEGYSAKPIIKFATIENLGKGSWDSPYQKAYKNFIVHNDERNEIIASAAKHSKGVVLVLVNQVKHGRIIQNLIPDSTFVSGSDNSTTRAAVLDAMRDSDEGVFIASPIFDEGVDIPSIDTLILAGGGKAHVKILQRIGRGMRQKDGENVIHIYDFIDDTNRYLLSHSEKRIDLYEQEGFALEIAQY